MGKIEKEAFFSKKVMNTISLDFSNIIT